MEIIWQLSLFLIPIFFVLTLLKPTSKKPNLPPGPPKLPIIGNLHQLSSKKTPPHEVIENLAKVYGPIMHLRLGEVSAIVISSPELAKAVLRTHDANFANRPEIMVGKYVYFDSSDIGLAPYGEYWRQVRKIATLELFTMRQVQSFRAVREEETYNMAKSLASMAAKGSVVNLTKVLFGLIFDITSRTVFNRKGTDQEAFRALITWISQNHTGFAIADIFPSLKFLHSIGGTIKEMEMMVEEANKILDPIINHHKFSEKNDQKEYLLDVLMKFHKDNVKNTSDFFLTTNNIKGIILEIFGAGSETSSLVIEWVMAELIKNPKAMEKAQYEVRKVQKDKGMVDESSLEELKFLKMVVKETMRLHPPAPFLVPRETIEHCQLQGYDIPARTRVVVNARTIGRDPNYWSEGDKFKPERFEKTSVTYKGNDFEYIPFGAGRRICPGMGLANANIELCVATLLYHFDWKLPNEMAPEDLNMDEVFGLSVRRKDELHVIPTLFENSCFKI
ncbi:desmethyl-deoxy-podophyllotoxin synthase-like [Amaranthus tricolor]|uniref:desmethyl-deoxy-podophyllotoxin synthase-like n=1 Tax=Amaranthus tricolor TaxID=29722 RepID=UPI00258CE830|nr:desmethyl-deoxy-podophyllotoxin synthase-like [Amaranthus tricolor]